MPVIYKFDSRKFHFLATVCVLEPVMRIVILEFLFC